MTDKAKYYVLPSVDYMDEIVKATVDTDHKKALKEVSKALCEKFEKKNHFYLSMDNDTYKAFVHNFAELKELTVKYNNLNNTRLWKLAIEHLKRKLKTK